MKQSKFPKGWDEEKVHKVLDHYEKQTEEESLVEDGAAYEDRTSNRTSTTFALLLAGWTVGGP